MEAKKIYRIAQFAKNATGMGSDEIQEKIRIVNILADSLLVTEEEAMFAIVALLNRKVYQRLADLAIADVDNIIFSIDDDHGIGVGVWKEITNDQEDSDDE